MHKDENKKENCLDKCYNKCSSSVKCRKFYFFFYAFICLLIILAELTSYNSPMLDADNYRNTTGEYEKMQEKKSFKGEEIPLMIFGYPIVLFFLFIATGIYILPLLYALIYRRLITGDFLYGKHSADTTDLAVSLEKITEMVFPCLYLSSVFYGMIYYKSKKEKFDINALYFFQIPHSDLILYFKDVFVLVCVLITIFFEHID